MGCIISNNDDVDNKYNTIIIEHLNENNKLILRNLI
jgi:hypothetical protein